MVPHAPRSSFAQPSPPRSSAARFRPPRLLLASLLGLTVTTACASSANKAMMEAGSAPEIAADRATEAPALQTLAEPGQSEDPLLSQAPAAPAAATPDAATLDAATPNAATLDAATPGANGLPSAPRSAPQLIKTAHLDLQVEDTAGALSQLVQQVRQNQGDVLNLEDQVPLNEDMPHSAYLEVRVPQERLDAALEQFSALGKVTNQQISAQDVSEQLVDFGARLRNLEKAEALTLGIMERSGNVGEILQVTQELARIREQIEQIKAQLQRLQTQVAYSTVYISLTEPVSVLQPLERSWGQDLSLAWQRSTRSLSAVTRGVVVLAIWLVVYSPYWLVFGAGTVFLAKFLLHQLKKPNSQPES